MECGRIYLPLAVLMFLLQGSMSEECAGEALKLPDTDMWITLHSGANAPNFADKKISSIQMTVRGIQLVTIMLKRNSQLVSGGYYSKSIFSPEKDTAITVNIRELFADEILLILSRNGNDDVSVSNMALKTC